MSTRLCSHPFLLVAISLKEVGKEAARNRIEKEVILSQAFLKEFILSPEALKMTSKLSTRSFLFSSETLEGVLKRQDLSKLQ